MLATRHISALPVALALLAIIAPLSPAFSDENARTSCSAVRSALDGAICADPMLSKLNEKMERVFDEKLAQLSAEGQRLLGENQRQYLEHVESTCLSNDRVLVDHLPQHGGFGLDFRSLVNADPQVRCLAKHITTRTERHLSEVVHQYGGRTFLRLISERIRRPGCTVADADNRDVVEEYIALDQLDAPRTQADRSFNKWIRDQLQREVSRFRARPSDDPCWPDRQQDGFFASDNDIWAGADIRVISDDLVYFELGVGYYYPGGAHPFFEQSRAFWSFSRGRELRSSDIFDATKPWDTALAKYAQQHVEPSIDGTRKEDLLPIGTIDRPENWSFEPAGLRLFFGQYELGGYLGAADVLIPWSILVPYLDESFDWRAIKRAP